LGKFFGDLEPKFKGAIYSATTCQANAGDSALDCGVKTIPIVWGSRSFEGEKRGTQTLGQG